MARKAKPGKEKSKAGGKGCFRWVLRTIEYSIYATALAVLVGAGGLIFLFTHYSDDLPSLEPLESYSSTRGTDARWSQSTQILAADGTKIGEFYEEDRVLIGIEQIPDVMQKAIIAVEDERFDPDHPQAWIRRGGIDPIGIVRAAIANLLAGKSVQGGSTITQQLAKNLFLTREKTVRRKIQEIILAYRIEQRFSDDEIMERYLNKVFFGFHAYGIASAAQRYFSVDLRKPGATLTLGQAAMLAGLAKAPSAYAPHRHRERAQQRQRWVLRRMAECGYIAESDIDSAYNVFWDRDFVPERVSVPDEDSTALQIKVTQARFFVEYVRQQMLKLVDTETLSRGGLVIRTTLDPKIQAAAEAAVRSGLEQLTKEVRAHGISLAKGPLEASLVAIDHSNGHILAMVGGSSWSVDNQFNRAVQARRQAGSSFKPIVYYAALASGAASLGTVLRDEAFEVEGTDWSPKNYDGIEHGPVLPRTALTHSYNIAAVRMLLDAGIENVIEAAGRDLGINTSSMQPYPSLALGAFEVTLLELTSAYSGWANLRKTPRGWVSSRIEPSPIISIADREGHAVKCLDGQVRSSLEPFPEFQLPKPEISFLMTSIMQSVVQRGTAASSVGRLLAGRIPAAGKTGTTDDYSDAWFVGYTPTMTAGVWVGFDERRTMGRGMTGGRAAGTIWGQFVSATAAAKPAGQFPSPPDNVIQVSVCPLSGMRPSPDCPNQISEYFVNTTAPTDFCPYHSDPAALQQFLLGDRAADTDAVAWPDQVSIGVSDRDILATDREALRAIIDAEAPRQGSNE